MNDAGRQAKKDLDFSKLEETLAKTAADLSYTQSIVDTVREPLLVLDSTLRVRTANDAFYIVGISECAGINRHVVGDERALQERRVANPSWPRVLQAASRGVA